MTLQIIKMETRPRKKRSPGRWGPSWSKLGREYEKPDRIYVWPESETVLENLVNRRNRPYEEYRKLLKKELGHDIKIRWSRYAGCTCPCSPGFIVIERRLDPSGNPSDMHVTVGGTF